MSGRQNESIDIVCNYCISRNGYLSLQAFDCRELPWNILQPSAWTLLGLHPEGQDAEVDRWSQYHGPEVPEVNPLRANGFRWTTREMTTWEWLVDLRKTGDADWGEIHPGTHSLLRNFYSHLLLYICVVVSLISSSWQKYKLNYI